MDVHDAAYRVAHDFEPDGAVGLAREMGVTPGTFLNQLNPNIENTGVSLGRAVAMTLAAGDFRILHAFANTCRHFAIPQPAHPHVSDQALLDLLLKRDAEMGDFAEAVAKSLEKGGVTAAEFAWIEREGYEAAAAILELVARLRWMAGVSKGGRHG